MAANDPFGDNKISNILGAKMAAWVRKQLNLRSQKNSLDSRDTENLVYLSNKTAWVRLVSSINLINQKDLDYFSKLGVAKVGQDPIALAREFTLFGGASLSNQGKQILRGGLGSTLDPDMSLNSYAVLGKSEVQKYGFRPMPGITSVSIETQGRLGSVRMATIEFRCWDKDQLDIMDALYFKLGYTMLLEWGHVNYYVNDKEKLQKTELPGINPFEKGITKEEIQRQIARKTRETSGNYDGMLGMVTNFNFSMNQEGGYNCSLKMVSLGILGNSLKINNPTNLPNILQLLIKDLNDVLAMVKKKEEDAKKAEENAKRIKEENERKQKLAEEEAAFVKASRTLDETIAALTPSDKIIGTPPSTAPGKEEKDSNVYFTSAAAPEKKATQFVAIRNINKGLNTVGQLVTYEQGGVILRLDEAFMASTTFYLDFSKIFDLGYSATLASKLKLDSFKEDQITATRKSEYTNDISYPLKNGMYYFNIKTSNEVILDQPEYDKLGIFEVTSQLSKEPLPDYITSDPVFEVLNYIKNLKSTEGFILNFFKETDKFTGTNITRSPISIKEINNKKEIVFEIQFQVPYFIEERVKKQANADPVSIQIPYKRKVVIEFTDTALISGIKAAKADEFNQSAFYTDRILPFINSQDPPPADPTAGGTVPPTGTSPGAAGNDPPQDTKESPLKTMSSLELILRTIQVYFYTRVLREVNYVDPAKLDSARVVDPYKMWEYKVDGQPITDFIFSNGIFSDFIKEYLNDQSKINEIKAKYQGGEKLNNENDRLKLMGYYGFATNLLANKESIELFTPVDFKKLLLAYVVPYDMSQGIEGGAQINSPVYIPLGLLLMIINNNSLIYDNVGDVSKPMIYVDFNPEHNFCLSNPSQLSTDPWICLISFDPSTQNDYSKLFDDAVLNSSKSAILALSGSSSETQLFNTQNNLVSEFLKKSGTGLAFKEKGVKYQGKVMNILVNIEYLMNVLKNSSIRDEENKVYLKSFLEQVILDVGKCIGNINIFRLSYNDQGNSYQVVDDQVIPQISTENPKEQILTKKSVTFEDNFNSEIPLFGKESIAESLDLKTDISTKLANMIAVSANSDIEKTTELSNSGDSFGYINEAYQDRYIPSRGKVKGSSINEEGRKKVSIDFNSAIDSIYRSCKLSKEQIPTATNYYIEKMNNLKGTDPATRASAMIPVSINFTTDGIAGLSMGQAFTVPDEVLPYTYNQRSVVGGENSLDKVGFAIIGLSHTIENNRWKTSVRSNMIFLKDDVALSTDFVTVDVKNSPSTFTATDAEFDDVNSEFYIPTSPQECKRVAGKPRKHELFLYPGATYPAAQGGILNEGIIQSSVVELYPGINANGSKIYMKGKPSFVQKVELALSNFKKGVKEYNQEEIVNVRTGGRNSFAGDALRDFDGQRRAHINKWYRVVKAGGVQAYVANPCIAYHIHGQAIDINQSGFYISQKGTKVSFLDDIISHGILYKSLYCAGLRRISNEWWHWSIGETNHEINQRFGSGAGSSADIQNFTQYSSCS